MPQVIVTDPSLANTILSEITPDLTFNPHTYSVQYPKELPEDTYSAKVNGVRYSFEVVHGQQHCPIVVN